MNDLRHAIRLFLSSPVFTLIAVLSLALGIGANTAMFSLFNSVLLKTLPVERPDDLVQVGLYNPRVRVFHGEFPPGMEGTSARGMNITTFGISAYGALRDYSTSLVGLAAHGRAQATLRVADQGDRTTAEVVSGNFFPVLGVRAGIGRLLAPDDDRKLDGDAMCVLSDSLWRQRFGSDRSIVGRSIQLNNRDFTVIGVTPAAFRGLDLSNPPQIYVPLTMRGTFVPAAISVGSEISWLSLIGRLKPGASPEPARLEMDAAYHRAYTSRTGKTTDSTVAFAGGSQGSGNIQRANRTTLRLLMWAVAIVLLAACANVANLLLSRAAGRRREIAIRLAIGATRPRLIRQLLVESLALSAPAGLAGFLLAAWMQGGLNALVLQSAVTADSVGSRPDLRVFAFNIGVSILVGLLFGLAPAVAGTRPDLAPALKGLSGDTSRRRWNLRNGLVVLQVALSLVLLVGAGLFARSLFKLRTADLGFARENLALFSIDLEDQGYKGAAASSFIEDVERHLESAPGVKTVSYADVSPMSGSLWMWAFDTPASKFSRENGQVAYTTQIGPAYFATLGTPIIQGREFTPADRAGSPRVAMINETMAKQFWPGESPVGKHLTLRGPTGGDLEIVGVVRDSKYQSITEKGHYTAYVATPQTAPGSVTFHVRARGDVGPVIAAARKRVHELDAKIPIYAVTTMEAQIEEGLTLQRMLSALSMFFGGLALLLALIGLYGVISYAVTRRTREIGIRMALGAQRVAVVNSVLRECAFLAIAGLAAGVPAALATSRWFAAYLYGLSPSDAPTYIGISVLLLGVGIAAGVIPARRASLVDPMVALREE